jgi:hypothetical protein
MLVARRDPPFHVDARNPASDGFEGNPAVKAPPVLRVVTAIQMFGSLLAVPVAIGSAYTFYRANFSPETTCQSLRSRPRSHGGVQESAGGRKGGGACRCGDARGKSSIE